MVKLELTSEDAALLHELLTIYLADFRREVAGTENPEFRHTLQRRQSFVEEVLQRLERERISWQRSRGGEMTMAAPGTIAGALVEEFRGRLARARSELYATVATTDDELATLEAHQAGSPPEDVMTEVASAILSRLEGREKHELDEIDAAQARLAAGTYGACEGCRQAIPLERLRAMPTARHCVTCQRCEER